MKNSRLILGFILFSLTILAGFFHFQKAYAYNSFTQGTGYFTQGSSGGTTRLNFTVFNTPAQTVYSTTTVTADDQVAFYANASSSLGSFTAIQTVTYSLINDTGGPAIGGQAHINCNDGAGNHAGYSSLVTVQPSSPAGTIQHIVYDFGTSGIQCDSSSLVNLTISADGGHNMGFVASTINNTAGVGITTVSGNYTSYYYNLLISINETYIRADNLATGAQSANCPTTSFSVAGADFGQGACVLARFLLVPSQDTLNQWQGSQTLLASTTPFSYLYTLSSLISNISTSTATMTPLTLDVGTGTPMHISFDMFSAATINRYTDNNSRSVLRTLMDYALYLAFVAMIILEVRHLFKTKKP